VKINEQFQITKQFWNYLVKQGQLSKPEAFIKPVPHMSFVQGVRNVDFLKRRVDRLNKNILFSNMEITDDKDKITEWALLIMKGRTSKIPMAITYDKTRTYVNFSALTKKLFSNLEEKNIELKYEHEVENLNQHKDGSWEVKVKN